MLCYQYFLLKIVLLSVPNSVHNLTVQGKFSFNLIEIIYYLAINLPLKFDDSKASKIYKLSLKDFSFKLDYL